VSELAAPYAPATAIVSLNGAPAAWRLQREDTPLNTHQLSLELATESGAPAAATVGLLFGGRSAEHEVSVRSAATICAALRAAGHWVVPIGIDRAGTWRCMPLGRAPFPEAVDERACAVTLAPGGSGQLMPCAPTQAANDLPRLEVVFPALHGPFGEDGVVQGLLEACGVPYVGAGVLAGALTMDKEFTKRLLLQAGLPVVPYRVHHRGEPVPGWTALGDTLGPRLFVKPSSLGSSIGAAPADDAPSLEAALHGALAHGDKVLVERRIEGRELECGVIDSENGPIASVVGEITTAPEFEFYDYEAKYLAADGARLDVPARLDGAIAARLRALAVQAFRALGCRDLARIDFFLDDRGQLFVNEINTLPGFTSISLFPRMFEATGIALPQLVARLVERALARSPARA
jgi:D-alanine-D-alanine ligase